MKTKDESKYLIIGIPLFIILNILDIFTTSYLIKFGYTELNFIMVDYVNSILLMALIKITGITILIISGYMIYKLYPEYKPIKNIPLLANVILGIVVINNLYLMYGC